MPANTTPYVIRVPERKCGDSKKYAAVLEFESDDLERINAFLVRLRERGIVTNVPRASHFDPNFTSPELYFP
jgi:hypothetical protein